MPLNFSFDGSSYVICSKWVINSWIIYLNLRQLKMMSGMITAPEYLRDVYPQRLLSLAKSYQFEKILLTIIFRFYDIFVFTAEIAMGAIPKLWSAAESLVSGDLSRGAVFMMLSLVTENLVYMPLKMFNIFVIEQHYGFNRQDVGTFVGDTIREVIIKTIFSLPLLWMTIVLIRWRPETFHWYLMVITLGFRLFMVAIYLDFLFPMLASFQPLPEGNLKARIQELANSVGFPLYDIYVMEASSRTTHGNAFFIGFSKKKMIVFFDTMLEGHIESGNVLTGWFRKKRYTENELLGILGHEMGHWKHSHIAKGLTLYQAVTCLEILLCSFLVGLDSIYTAVGFTDEIPPTFIGFMVVSEVFLLPFEFLVHYVSVSVNRRFELEADSFSCQLGQTEGLIAGLKKITVESLRLPTADMLYSAWYDTHPSLDDRLRNLERYRTAVQEAASAAQDD